MPGFDGTGPGGRGPMTGRGMGYCAVPVGDIASVRAAVSPQATPYYPVRAIPPRAVPYAGLRNAYARFAGCLRFGCGRGFVRRGGRGRRW